VAQGQEQRGREVTIRSMTRVHPVLRAALARVYAGMAAWGHPMAPCETERSVERQRELWAQGRTKPGPVVTWVDGSDPSKSKHLIQPDGYCHAVDSYFTTGPAFGEAQPWAVYGAMCEAEGLTWGGTWRKADKPHVQIDVPGDLEAA
jgi:peptidoglycan L-alanyl-D-glutamate endopeptidase CwlK